MGIIADIHKEVQSTGGSFSKIFFVKSGSKKRIRFLTDGEDAYQFIFHDSYKKSINMLCLEELGKECPYCKDDEIRTRKMFVWVVWDYDAKAVKLLCYAANNCTPVLAIASMYENYGTLLERDFTIERHGEKQDTTYTVIPSDKTKFRQTKETQVPTKKEILKILSKAYPMPDSEDDEEYTSKKKAASKAKNRDYDDEQEEDEDIFDYEDMSALELYKLCKKRGITCKPKKSEEYYINLLEDYDDEQVEESEDDEW